MQHLDLETLARLVDEAPEPHEAEHLRGCLVCRRELAEMREQTQALAGLGELPPPAGAWADLEARLVEEALVRTPAPASRRVLGLYRPPMRIAAALALFLLGGAAGAALWRDGGPQGRVAVDVPAADPAPSASRMRPLADPELLIVSEPDAQAPEATGNGNGARLAMNGAAPEARRPVGVVPPRRTRPERATRAQADRAARELVQAQAEYVAALQRVAAIADRGLRKRRRRRGWRRSTSWCSSRQRAGAGAGRPGDQRVPPGRRGGARRAAPRDGRRTRRRRGSDLSSSYLTHKRHTETRR